jgi:outer membrane protein
MKPLALCLACCMPVWAQQPVDIRQLSIEPVRPQVPIVIRPYQAAEVPPVRLNNAGRFGDKIRGGNLYLTAQDAIAYALENNIDIEIARYNPIVLEWRLERSQAGGALPGVPSASSQASSNTSGQGVLGSQQAAGITGGNTGVVRNTSNATVQQIGPVTQTLDSVVQESTAFSHRSLPQSNATGSAVQVIVQNQRSYSGSLQQGFVTGGSLTVSFNNRYLNENAPTDVLNPSLAPSLAFSFTHNLLNGFGKAVGGRNITIAKLNLNTSDLTFRTQVSRVLGNVLNAYYTLSGDFDDVKSKQGALDTSRSFLSETSRRQELGSSALLDVTTAQNQVAVATQAFVNTQLALAQQEVLLKNLISRTGLADPELAGVHIVPLDKITVPAAEALPPVSELVKKAFAMRTDLLSTKAGLETSEISALGTRNGLLPNLQVTVNRSTSGLAGVPRIVRGGTADPQFVGGVGTALGQVFSQTFPTQSASIGGRMSLENRQAQADYGIDQLSLRQQQLASAKELNQAEVDVLNAVVALRQSHGRFDAAVESRTLQQKLYDAEQKKFAAGESTTYNVRAQLRDLTNAQGTELASLVTYQNARTYLDQTTGLIIENNKISIADARSGKLPQR